MCMVTLALSATSPALGADEAGLYWKVNTAIAARPTGLIAEGQLEHRAPVMRFGGVAFNDTFMGAGTRFTATPAFVEAAARMSFQPVDVLPLKVEAVYTGYWDSPFGLLPFSEMEFHAGTDGPQRRPRYQGGEGFAGHMLSLQATPRFQIKLGPIVGFTSWTVAWVKILPDNKTNKPWVYEPFRGMVVAFDDLLVDHTSALLYQAGDGTDSMLLRVGAGMLGKWSRETPDETLALGGLMQIKPGSRPATPTLLVVAAPYLRDPDLLGPIPFMAMQATWER